MHTWNYEARLGDVEASPSTWVPAPKWSQVDTQRLLRRLYGNRYLLLFLLAFCAMCVYIVSIFVQTIHPAEAHDASVNDKANLLYTAAKTTNRKCMHIRELGHKEQIAIVAGQLYVDFQVTTTGDAQHEVTYNPSMCPGTTKISTFSMKVNLSTLKGQTVLLRGNDAYCAQTMAAVDSDCVQD